MRSRPRNTDESLLSGVVPALDCGGEGAPRIGTGRLDASRVARFNAILARLCPRSGTLVAGQIAAAARRLLFGSEDARARGEASVARRLERIVELERMRADHGFALDDGVAERIRALLAYVEQRDDLIPDDTPVIGRLDDAILIELLLRELGPELADYADYCDYRREMEARTGGGEAAPPVDSTQWLAARRAAVEAARAQRREPFDPTPVRRGFRIG